MTLGKCSVPILVNGTQDSRVCEGDVTTLFEQGPLGGHYVLSFPLSSGFLGTSGQISVPDQTTVTDNGCSVVSDRSKCPDSIGVSTPDVSDSTLSGLYVLLLSIRVIYLSLSIRFAPICCPDFGTYLGSILSSAQPERSNAESWDYILTS